MGFRETTDCGPTCCQLLLTEVMRRLTCLRHPLRREDSAGRLLRGGSAAAVMSPVRELMLAAADSADLHRADTSPAAVTAAATHTPFTTHDDAGQSGDHTPGLLRGCSHSRPCSSGSKSPVLKPVDRHQDGELSQLFS